MNIEDLTIKQVREISEFFEGDKTPKTSYFKVGKSYIIRTVTQFNIGTVVAIIGNHLIMKDGAWIVDTGRFHQCLTTGSIDEVEPWPGEFGVNLDTVVDYCEWVHDMPRTQK